jgi:hypothetical protein
MFILQSSGGEQHSLVREGGVGPNFDDCTESWLSVYSEPKFKLLNPQAYVAFRAGTTNLSVRRLKNSSGIESLSSGMCFDSHIRCLNLGDVWTNRQGGDNFSAQL